MSFWDKMLLTAVIVAAIASWPSLRAWLWLSIGVLDYLLTAGWYDLGWPAHTFVTAMVDTSVCLTIYEVCKRRGGQRWEIGVYIGFFISVLAGLAQMTAELRGNASDTLYRLALEGGNWLAILSIAGSGTIRLADAADFGLGWHRDHDTRLHRVVDALYAPVRISPTLFVRAVLQAIRA